ncbi:MAG: ABC transporter ATP-binding protein [Bacilli bacterium]|nr:ABC transporter ATP-binding protein [Bacilli bacterium]
MVILEDVNKDYGENENIVHALRDVNLRIENGKLTAIIGKSGSGKSTLMNMIGALDKPTSGEVFFNDENITGLSEKQLAEYRNKKTGFVFQAFHLEPSFTVLENVCMPLTISGVDKKEREERAVKLLILLDILEKKNKKASELSAGQKQRVAIARALINNPEIILADEPTGNLDSENGEEVMKILKNIASLGKMVVLVTHNLEDAKKYADVIIELKDGKVASILRNDCETI